MKIRLLNLLLIKMFLLGILVQNCSTQKNVNSTVGLALLLVLNQSNDDDTSNQSNDNIFKCSNYSLKAGEACYQAKFDLKDEDDKLKTAKSNLHYTPFIGAVHNTSTTFWKVGQKASPGIEEVAETGSITKLDQEIKEKIKTKDALSIISKSGNTNLKDVFTLDFIVNNTHSVVTLISMLAPSPDWFIGVSNLELKDTNNNWKATAEKDIIIYDSGTEEDKNGFTLTNADENPKKDITRFSGTTPAGAFIDGKLDGNNFGKITFTKKK